MEYVKDSWVAYEENACTIPSSFMGLRSSRAEACAHIF